MTEFADQLDARLRALVADLDSSYRVSDGRLPYDPNAGADVFYSVDYSPSGDHPRVLLVAVDIDIFSPGPDRTLAENIAAAIEVSLIDWSVVTVRQGVVRLHLHSRAVVEEESEKLAHVTLRVTGRCFRRV